MTTGLLKEKELIAVIYELVLEAKHWRDDEMTNFLYKLININIKDQYQFEERFCLSTDDPRPYQDLAWNHYYDWEDMGDALTSLKGLVIDWELTYSTYLIHLYQDFYFQRRHYFFHQNSVIFNTDGLD
jgi:hypothetical protein